jgi:hypothetical protein
VRGTTDAGSLQRMPIVFAYHLATSTLDGYSDVLKPIHLVTTKARFRAP